MVNRKFIAVPCQLFPGAFSGERVFVVALANGDSYRSGGPREFCWNARGELVGPVQPPAEGEDGFLAARMVEQLDGEQVAVEIPDGEVIAVPRDSIRARPTEIRPPVPVLQSVAG